MRIDRIRQIDFRACYMQERMGIVHSFFAGFVGIQYVVRARCNFCSEFGKGPQCPEWFYSSHRMVGYPFLDAKSFIRSVMAITLSIGSALYKEIRNPPELR